MPRRARRVSHARDPQVEAQLDELVRAQNEHVESPTDVHGVGPLRVAKTSREDQWPDWSDVQGKPEAFPPALHAPAHAAGGADPVTPASIGAETPQGAQEKADLAEANAKAYTDAHAADASLHVTPDYRAAMDNAKAPPSATNPFVTEETLNDAMTGSAKPGVATLAELAAIPPEQRADRDTRLVEEDGRIYRFDAEATEGDVKPNVGSGYWIAVAAATQNHNNLAGLQGGSAEERYHLTRSEHDMVLAHPSQNTGVHGVGTAYVAKTSRADQWPDWGDIRNKPSTFTPSAHASTHAAGGADPITPASIGAETPAGAQAKADAVQTALDAHRGASTLDHPDGSVTDAKIGSRTIDQAQAPSGSSGLLTQLLSWLANRIKAITGKNNWYDAPDTTLAAAKAHMDANTGVHGVGSGYYLAKTSRSDQLPAWGDIQGKPSSYTPSPHKSTHASGGSDELTPADIGAVSKAGDTMNGPLIFGTGFTLAIGGDPSTRKDISQGQGWNNAWAGIEMWGDDPSRAGELMLYGSYISLRAGKTKTGSATEIVKITTAGVSILGSYLQLPVLSSDPSNPPNGAMWMRS